MQLVGAPLSPLLNSAQNSLSEQIQQMRIEDAQLRSEASRIAAQAQADGKTVTTQVSYKQGPDGKSYVSSITVTQSGMAAVNDSAKQPLAANMADISPARLPLSPSDMAEGFAQRAEQAAQDIAEASALTELQRADVGVRVHEGLHYRAAGGVAQGGVNLEYIQGPDGQYYAVAGHVDVQTSTTTDPEKAAREAQAFAMAASAPGDASAQDNHAARGAHNHATEAYGRVVSSRNAPVVSYDVVA